MLLYATIVLLFVSFYIYFILIIIFISVVRGYADLKFENESFISNQFLENSSQQLKEKSLICPKFIHRKARKFIFIPFNTLIV